MTARATAWGEGQFDHVELGAGLHATLRITPAGEVVLLTPLGEQTMTELTLTPMAACLLGQGLQEASRRAAAVRVALEGRERRRAQKRGRK